MGGKGGSVECYNECKEDVLVVNLKCEGEVITCFGATSLECTSDAYTMNTIDDTMKPLMVGFPCIDSLRGRMIASTSYVHTPLPPLPLFSPPPHPLPLSLPSSPPSSPLLPSPSLPSPPSSPPLFPPPPVCRNNSSLADRYHPGTVNGNKYTCCSANKLEPGCTDTYFKTNPGQLFSNSTRATPNPYNQGTIQPGTGAIHYQSAQTYGQQLRQHKIYGGAVGRGQYDSGGRTHNGERNEHNVIETHCFIELIPITN